MSQAIQTRYLGPSDFKSARVKAVAHAGSVTKAWDHELNTFENHEAVALQLATCHGWDVEKLIGGELHDGTYAFVVMTWKRKGPIPPPSIL